MWNKATRLVYSLKYWCHWLHQRCVPDCSEASGIFSAVDLFLQNCQQSTSWTCRSILALNLLSNYQWRFNIHTDSRFSSLFVPVTSVLFLAVNHSYWTIIILLHVIPSCVSMRVLKCSTVPQISAWYCNHSVSLNCHIGKSKQYTVQFYCFFVFVALHFQWLDKDVFCLQCTWISVNQLIIIWF